MSTKILSIIVPVFNGEAYIQACLNALMPQVNNAIEVIVVDDGSVDNTRDLIKKTYAPYIANGQLVLLAKENQGVSAARNDGIALAKGAYIGFMDSDDWPMPNYIETLLSAMQHDTDIVEFGFKTFENAVNETKKNASLYSNPQFGLHTVKSVTNTVYGTSRWYPWTRIFKKNLFLNVQFPVGVRFCEDLMTIPKLYENALTILVLEQAIYGYRMNPNGATRNVGQDYTDKLAQFYQTIPTTGRIQENYLRLSVAGAMVSCQIKSHGDWQLPEYIQQDLYRLRGVFAIYRYIHPRMVLMLLYPTLFKTFKNILFFGKNVHKCFFH